MKTKTAITAIAASILVTASAASAKDMKDKDNRDKQASFSNGSVQMQRVANESLDNILTAKSLIGASVYDAAGEKIGDIADISMGQSLGSNVAQKYLSAQQDDDAHVTPGYGSTTTPMSPDARKDEISKDRDESGQQRSAQWRDMKSGPVVFISVGGLWGIGDDIVAVPARSLGYDRAKERFTLAASKAEVVALAEQDPTVLTENFDWGSQSWNDEYSAKQEFDSQADDVRNAIKMDSSLRNENSISVSIKNDTLVLEGTVSSKDAKSRAQALAEDHTDMDVKNMLDVKKK